MSRQIAIFALVAFCLSTFVVAETAEELAIFNRQFLLRQKAVYELLWHVDQPEKQPHYYTVGQAYSIEDNLANYTDQESVKEFLALYKSGKTLPRGEIFSIFYPPILEQAKALFRVFYYSKDYETLFNTAAWARIYMNEGLFVYAFSVAVTHHEDTYLIRVPAYHEIYPHFYFDDGVIREAYNAKITTVPGSRTIIPASNHSKYPLDYYTEDIAVNDAPYYFHLLHPFWMSSEEYGTKSARSGKAFFWMFRNQLARYYMERFSNGLSDIEDIDWHQRIPYGFTPNLSYHNGFKVPSREAYSHVPSYNYRWLKTLRDYEYRISAAIDMGYTVLKNGTFSEIHNSEGIDILGNLIQGNVDSVNFDLYGSYDVVARSVLGFGPKAFNNYQVFPSVMQQYGLDQRDPIYWSLVKTFVGFYNRFVSHLPAYTHDELAFPGVKIESVAVDKVTTYFSYYDYFISGAVKLYNADDKALIFAHKHRLTHKPYSYSITVTSPKAFVNSTISVFLGPKYNQHHEVINMAENWENFMLIDRFFVDLKPGSNVFEHSSIKSRFGVPDEVSGDVFYTKILNALAGNEIYEIPEHLYGYPERMFMPKGKKEGLPMQFFFFVSPPNDKHLYPVGTEISAHEYFVDAAGGYPLDKPPTFDFTEFSNAYFYDFNIYHSDEEEINATV